MALSRVTDLKGLHLINFEPNRIKANKLALVEYKRLGSKSSVEDGATTNSAKVVPLMRHAERIWYITSAHQKAMQAVDGMVEDDTAPIRKSMIKGKHAKRKTSMKRSKDVQEKTRGKQSSPAISSKVKPRVKFPKESAIIPPTSAKKSSVYLIDIDDDQLVNLSLQTVKRNGYDFVNINMLRSTTDSIAKILQLVISPSDYVIFFTNKISTTEMEQMFSNIIVPYGDYPSDVMVRRLAVELHPDPFGEANHTTQKWLSSDILKMYGQLLKDISLEKYGVNLYYVGTSARNHYVNNFDRYIDMYISNTHEEWSYSTRPQFTDTTYDAVKGFRSAGDPLTKDVIILFCNDFSMHWYLLIVDLRPLRPRKWKIIQFDSSYSPNNDVLRERCNFVIRFLNDLRNKVATSPEYRAFDWRKRSPLRENEFEFIDGMSVQQTNGFDCGVYACINAESYVNGEDHNKFHANSIPLMRIKYIRDIYSFRRNSNFPPQYLNIEWKGFF